MSNIAVDPTIEIVLVHCTDVCSCTARGLPMGDVYMYITFLLICTIEPIKINFHGLTHIADSFLRSIQLQLTIPIKAHSPLEVHNINFVEIVVSSVIYIMYVCHMLCPKNMNSSRTVHIRT